MVVVALTRVLSLIVLVVLTYASSEEQSCVAAGSCDIDGSSSSSDCEDTDESCELWAREGECYNNPGYMIAGCPKACNLCITGEDEYGIAQTRNAATLREVDQAVLDMKAYVAKMRQDPNATEAMLELLDNCKNKNEACARWKVQGECEANPVYMKVQCAPICQTCDFLTIEKRCPLDPDAPNAWGPGDLNEFFVNITTLPQFQKYEPIVISRPDYVNGDTEETADYQLGPWVAVLDNFVTAEEADRLIQLGREEGYQRSSDVGKINFDGTTESNINDGRTSKNAWCQNKCYNDTVAKQLVAKITDITHLPEENSEFLQLLSYTAGQYYRTHHDYIPHLRDRQAGVRLLTIFLYLNDVEEGGGTFFPMLSPPVTVFPKRGRALIWPSVLDEDPNAKDGRTLHSALVVEKGLKYGANAWIHMRDFKTPNLNGCE